MSRFLITTWDGGGNSAPAFNLGARLARRGHNVLVTGWQGMADRAVAAGVGFEAYPSLEPWPAGTVLDDDWGRLTEYLFGRRCKRDIVNAARAFGADALVLDCMLRAGFDAQRELGLPAATLMHLSYEQFVHGWGDGFMGASVAGLLEATETVLALQPPGFDPPRAMPTGHEYVGAIASPDVPAALPVELSSRGDPWVLLSLSTTSQHGQLELYQSVLDGLATAPVRVLVTLGAATAGADLRVPPNALLTGYLPHLSVLPQVSLVISHAGMTTVAMALASGVPLVCVPLGRDQGGNADRVAAIGAGLVPGVSGVPAAVAEIMANSTYRDAAARIAAAAVPLGWGERATDLVEGIALNEAQPRSSGIELSRPAGRPSR